MGHYASEMSCPECGRLRCACAWYRPDPEVFVVVDYRVLSLSEAKERGMTHLSSLFATTYPTRERAQEASRVQLGHDRARAEALYARLRELELQEIWKC